MMVKKENLKEFEKSVKTKISGEKSRPSKKHIIHKAVIKEKAKAVPVHHQEHIMHQSHHEKPAHPEHHNAEHVVHPVYHKSAEHHITHHQHPIQSNKEHPTHHVIRHQQSHKNNSITRPHKKHHKHKEHKSPEHVVHHNKPVIHHAVHHKMHHTEHHNKINNLNNSISNVPNKSVSNTQKKYSKFETDKDVAMDFATRVHRMFDHLIKATVLFGSQTTGEAKPGSDIDIIIIIDDAAINWDLELTSWYREELAKLIASQNYGKDLHINTIRLTTWWRDLLHGDPVVLNIIRQGQVLIDIGGFFTPIKALMMQGKIHSTPEAVYAALQRSPQHLIRSKLTMLGSVEGVYWCMVEAAQAALITLGKLPPSPEHVTKMLQETFVETGVLKSDFVKWYRDIYLLHKQISHGEIRQVKAAEIEAWQSRAEEFMKKMVDIIDKLIEAKKNAVQR